jgi:hypothetical protein
MTQAQVTTRRRWQVVGWSSLIASALLLASLVNASVTNGTAEVVPRAARVHREQLGTQAV